MTTNHTVGPQNSAQDAERVARAAARITKLLAVAADDRAPIEERQTAAAKAAEIRLRHGIDADQLRAARGQTPEAIRVYPYAVAGAAGLGEARAILVYRVAEALGCQAILHTARPPQPSMTIIVGTVSDIDTLRTLLPVLLAQAEYGAAAQCRDRSVTRAYLTSFFVAYGEAAAERIAARRRDLIDEARRDGTGADLVLADRDRRVREVYEAKFTTAPATVPGSNRDGRAAGQRAGRAADLGDGRVTNSTTGRAELTT